MSNQACETCRLEDSQSTRAKLSASPERPIALLLNNLDGGGAQRRTAALANRFVELGSAVDVVSTNPGDPMRKWLLPDVRVKILVPAGTRPHLSAALYARMLAEYLGQSGARVLMSCVTDTHLLAVAASIMDRRRVPLVLRASRHPYRVLDRPSIVKRAIERFNLRKAAWYYAQADAIVALSTSSVDGLRRLMGDRGARIETILNPVVPYTLLDRPEERLEKPTGRVPIVLGVGRLAVQKDFSTLLRAFAIVRHQRPARLVLLGQGPEADRLRVLALELGIAADVEFMGEVENVTEWMRRADLVVSASLWEGLQSTLIEALAVGCPVVATDCPGAARETLQNGKLGSLVPVRNPEMMARGMVEQLDHPPTVTMLAAGAAPFTPAGKAEKYLALFDSLQVEPGPSSATF